MTNHTQYKGKHRTEARTGTVEGRSDNPRGQIARSAGAIMRDAWSLQAAGTNMDRVARRTLRSLSGGQA